MIARRHPRPIKATRFAGGGNPPTLTGAAGAPFPSRSAPRDSRTLVPHQGTIAERAGPARLGNEPGPDRGIIHTHCRRELEGGGGTLPVSTRAQRAHSVAWRESLALHRLRPNIGRSVSLRPNPLPKWLVTRP